MDTVDRIIADKKLLKTFIAKLLSFMTAEQLKEVDEWIDDFNKKLDKIDK